MVPLCTCFMPKQYRCPTSEHNVALSVMAQLASGIAAAMFYSTPTGTCRSARKASAARYGKPVMMPSSDSTAASDAGTGTASDAEDTFPASYQAPIVGLMGKGKSATLFA